RAGTPREGAECRAFLRSNTFHPENWYAFASVRLHLAGMVRAGCSRRSMAVATARADLHERRADDIGRKAFAARCGRMDLTPTKSPVGHARHSLRPDVGRAFATAYFI